MKGCVAQSMSKKRANDFAMLLRTPHKGNVAELDFMMAQDAQILSALADNVLLFRVRAS
jgi:hypothetical protein